VTDPKPTLTLEELREMKKVFDQFDKNDHVIKKWKKPFLWLLWLFKGVIVESEGFKFYILDWMGTRYLLKITGPNEQNHGKTN
jgi:hypothetical protein